MKEAIALTKKGDPSSLTMIKAHNNKSAKSAKGLSKSTSAEINAASFISWCRLVEEATMKWDTDKATGMLRVIDKKASRMEGSAGRQAKSG